MQIARAVAGSVPKFSGINSHGSAYINNFGVAAMLVAVVMAPQMLDKFSAAISAALAPAAQLIPNFM